MRSTVSGLSRGAICAVALMSWTYSPTTAAANDDAAHALAEKFSQAGEGIGARRRSQSAKAAKARAAGAVLGQEEGSC